jgi:bifunctional glutamyl/prolyl-tRNA synthetase
LGNTSAEALNTNIISCGDYIRKIKAEKASKDQILSEVKVLKLLKDMYKSKTGQDWQPSGGQEAAKPKAVAKKQPVEKAEGNQ